MFKVELTHSQLWIVTKAILCLTSPEGEQRLLSEFPAMDVDALSADLEALLDKLEKAVI